MPAAAEVNKPVRAFPNAYVDVEEPPNKSFRNRIIALVALLGVLYFIAVVLVLHVEPTGYDPVSRAVSDYAVGAFGYQMGSAFFIGGAGLACLGAALYLARANRKVASGSLLLLLSGASLFLVGAFPTDLEGSPTTFHGAMHVTLSAVVFIASPAGMLLVSSGTSRRWLLATIAALGAAVVFAATGSALALNINGLTERGYIAVLAGWWLAASLKALRSP